MARKGETGQAIREYEMAVNLNPDDVWATSRLAELLATATDRRLRNGPPAVALAHRAASAVSFGSARVLDVLATAYAAAGDYDRAARYERDAIRLASVPGHDAQRKSAHIGGADPAGEELTAEEMARRLRTYESA